MSFSSAASTSCLLHQFPTQPILTCLGAFVYSCLSFLLASSLSTAAFAIPITFWNSFPFSVHMVKTLFLFPVILFSCCIFTPLLVGCLLSWTVSFSQQGKHLDSKALSVIRERDC